MNTTVTHSSRPQLFFLMPLHLPWWVWFVTATLLAVGLSGYTVAYWVAIALTFAQLLVFWVREGSVRAFSVQLRMAFAMILCVCLLPFMHWLFWLPTVGTFAMLIFGYCLLARMLYLLPWNRSEPMTFNMLRRTFLSRPQLPSDETDPAGGCAGGVCSIEAQVKRRESGPNVVRV